MQKRDAPIPTPLFRERLAPALSSNSWVVDGNYSQVRDIIWSRADTVVWLDYPLPVVLHRLVRRTFRRVLAREQLWNGNRETLATTFSRDSVVLWAIQTHPQRRKEFPILLKQPEYAHLTAIHLRSPKAAQDWLSRLKPQTTLSPPPLGVLDVLAVHKPPNLVHNRIKPSWLNL